MSRLWKSLVTGDSGLAAQGVARTGFIEGIVFTLLASSSATIGLAGSALAISAITGAVSIGLAVGLSYLSSSLFAPKQPKPEDVQSSVKNPTSARKRHYGRVKTSGSWVFAESKNGNFHKVIELGTGLLDAIEELWIDDNIVTVNSSGLVQTPPYKPSSKSYARILTRKGLVIETAYSQLSAEFPAWDANHRGDGVSSLYATQFAIQSKYFSQTFPNVTNTAYRVVARGSLVYNPVTEAIAWSENAAAIIRDYAIHADGARLPEALFQTPQAVQGWKTAYNRAAQPIPRKAGGTEAAYRLWGSYAFDERPADVFGRMLQCCDARFVPTPDGGVTLDIGTWTEPTVTIDEDAIVGFSDLSRGRDILTTANTIPATYLSPTHDYQATDAQPWVDEDDVGVRGEIISDKAFNMAPSHGQARRLMKLAAYRASPNWVGSFQCNMRGLAAFGERFIRIKYPLFGIDEVFEVNDFRFDIGEGGILQGVSLQVHSMPQAAYSWDAATEEGDPPISEEIAVDNSIPVPAKPSFGVTRITVGGQQVPYGVLSFDAAPSEALIVEGQYKKTSAADWIVIAIDPDTTSSQFGALSDGEQYEARIRYVTLTGRQGDWSESAIATPVADPTAPGIVTAVSATGGTGTATLNWTAPNSANYVGATIRRNTVNVEAGAPIRLEYGPPSTADSWQDIGLAPGTYYYWIRSANASAVESAPAATGAVTVS